MRVLACIDLKQNNAAMLTHARAFAGPDGEVVLLHVAMEPPDFPGHLTPMSRDELAHDMRSEHRDLEKMAADLRAGFGAATSLMVEGDIIEKILEHAERLPADLIVLTSTGHWAVHDLLVKSVVRGVLRKANVPVVVVPLREHAAAPEG